MKTIRIIHFSDLHESAPLQTVSAFFDKRLLGRLNSIFRRRFDRETIRRAVPVFLKTKPDLFVFTGDASTCSQPLEFEMALEDLSPLIRSGIPILYSPGNHDFYVNDPQCRSAFDEFLKTLSCGAFGLESYPFIRDFNGFQIIVVNTALATKPWMSSGLLSKETLLFLQKKLTDREKPVLLASHFPVFHSDSLISGLRRKMYGCEMIRNLNPDLVLCGHIHEAYQLPHENCCGSISKHGIYSLITFDGSRFTVKPESL